MEQMTVEQRPLMTQRQVADLLNVSKAHVIKLARLGRIRRVDVDGAVRYTPESVEQYQHSIGRQ